MSRRTRLIIIAFLAGLIIAGWSVLYATASPDFRYTATVLCNRPLAEDAAAHLKLVRYVPTDGTLVLVYRCRRGGY